ncbi:MAG: Fe-S cluster assembly protein SufD [Acidiferrobacterales bacterium]
MITADQQTSWAQQLIAQADTQPTTFSPHWLREVRRSARQALAEMPVLDRKLERWRYTSIENLLKEPLQAPTQPIDLQAVDINQYGLLDFDAYRLVFVNGQYAAPLSTDTRLPEGVTLGSLRSALVTDADALAAWFGQAVHGDEHVFTALNSALVNDGLFIHVESNVALVKPIEVIYLSQTNDTSLLIQSRNLVVLDAGAKATLIERFIGADGSHYFHNNLTEILVRESASLNHYRVQEESRSAYHLSSVTLALDKQSDYHAMTLAFGGGWARTEYNTIFKQEGAKCNLSGLYTVGDRQLNDFHLNVEHRVPACVSRAEFKGILYGNGRAVFDGRIVVNKNAQKSDAQLVNDNLLLTTGAEVDTKPQLEIYADDVKCSHGTTVGQLDSQQIFYLRSRGIDDITARKMLCVGFANEMLQRIDIPELHRYVVGKLNDTLDAAAVVPE